ncbi:MAG: hypothetical protein V4772_06095 [Pseudomonadota bacterium]
MNLNHADIERLLPHKGAMCFLDAVTDWDDENICCSATAPGTEHPLMRSGRVSAFVAIEYAAQATALHGALLDAASSPQAGMLATLRDVDLHRMWFPVSDDALTIHAKLLSRTAGGCSYSFKVASARQPIASGCLLVAFRSSIER